MIFLDQSVFLSFGHTEYFVNTTPILVTRIELADDTALTCHTDSITCCRGRHNPNGSNGFGEWVFPNGSRIAQDSVTGDGFYWIRGYQTVKLYRQGDIQAPLGRYCCRIPDNYGATRTFCANIVGTLFLHVMPKWVIRDDPFLNSYEAIQCPSLENIDNGTIHYSTTETNGLYIYGTVATYSCSPGYGLSSTRTRMCVGDGSSETVGKFSGEKPSCEGKK